VTVYRRGSDEQVVYPLGPVAPPELPTPRVLTPSVSADSSDQSEAIAWAMASALVLSLAAVGALGFVSVRRVSRNSVD